MAIYVVLLKEYKDDEKVVYKYGPSEEAAGKIEQGDLLVLSHGKINTGSA